MISPVNIWISFILPQCPLLLYSVTLSRILWGDLKTHTPVICRTRWYSTCPRVTEAKTEPWAGEGKLALTLSPLFNLPVPHFSKILCGQHCLCQLRAVSRELRLHITGPQSSRKPWQTVISAFEALSMSPSASKLKSLFSLTSWFEWSLPRPQFSVVTFLAFKTNCRLGWNILNLPLHIIWISAETLYRFLAIALTAMFASNPVFTCVHNSFQWRLFPSSST